MHKQRLAVVIAAGLGVIATFLPWVSITIPFFGTTSASGLSVWQGILTLLLCGAAGAFAIIGDNREGPIDSANVKIVAGAGGAAFLIVLLTLFSYMGSSSGLAGVGGGLGIGVWLALIAALGIVAVPFVIKDSGEFEMPTKDSIKDEFNEMKDN